MSSEFKLRRLGDPKESFPSIGLFSWCDTLGRVGELSKREMQVFLLLGAGMSNRQISRQLSVTERTTKAHVAQIMSKLKVESRLQAGLASYSLQVLMVDEVSPERNCS